MSAERGGAVILAYRREETAPILAATASNGTAFQSETKRAKIKILTKNKEKGSLRSARRHFFGVWRRACLMSKRVARTTRWDEIN